MNSIEQFLSAKTYAVADASNHHHKYGNKVFRALLAADRETYPLRRSAQVAIARNHALMRPR